MKARIASTTVRVFVVAVGVSLALAAASCKDYNNLTGVGTKPTDSTVTKKAGSDSVPPRATVASPTGSLEVGDTISMTVSDNVKLAKAALLIMAGTDSVVFSSDTVSLATLKDTITTLQFVVKAPADSIPGAYGRTLRAVGYVLDSAGNASYSGRLKATDSDLRLAPGVAVTILEGKTTHSPVSVDDIVRMPGMPWFYYVSSSANTMRMYVADKDKVAPWSLAVGSHPSRVTYAPRGPTAQPVIVTANAGGRELSYSSFGDTASAGVLGARVASPDLSVFVDSATTPSRIPGNGVASVTELCRPNENCRTLVSVLGTSGQTFIHSVALTGDPVANFEFVAPGQPFTDVFGDTTKKTIRVKELVGVTYKTLFSTTVASTCGTLFNSTPLAVARADGQGALYVAGSVGPHCSLLRLVESGGAYSLDIPAAYNSSGDPRLTNINLVSLDSAGARVLIMTGTDVYVADSTLHVTGAASGAGLNQTPTGAGFMVGAAGTVADGAWLVVASTGALTVYRSADFRPLAVFKTRATVQGKAWIVPSGVGDGLIIGGATSTKDGFVAVHTSVSAINARSLKFNRLANRLRATVRK